MSNRAGRLFLSLIGLVAVLTAADFNTGLEAYKRRDYATAFREWKPLAEQGDVRAQNNIGTMYAGGRGVRLDYVEARKWLQRAADQGDPTAKEWLRVIAGLRNPLMTSLLRFSLSQLVALFFGVALVIWTIAGGCSAIANSFLPDDPKPRTRRQIGVRIGILAVVLLVYYYGATTARALARSRGESSEAAFVSSVYSWFYVGGTFVEWMIGHRSEPLGKSFDEFRAMMGGK